MTDRPLYLYCQHLYRKAIVLLPFAECSLRGVESWE